MNSVNIFHSDCLDKLKSFVSNSLDLLLTDPPYGYNFNNSKKFNDKTVPNIAIWRECYRVLKPGAWCIVMSAPRQDVLSAMIHRLTDAGFKTNFTSIYWTYNTGNPKGRYPANLLVSDKILNNNSKYFDIDAWAKENSFNESDLLGQIEPSPLDIFPFINIPKPCKTEKTKDSGLKDFCNVDKYRGKFPASQVKNADIVHHPTVKPIKLFSYLATMFSRPNDVILDPFMGSGTTGIAALKSKRSFIGIEIVEEYYNLSKKRINAVHRRLKLTD